MARGLCLLAGWRDALERHPQIETGLTLMLPPLMFFTAAELVARLVWGA